MVSEALRTAVNGALETLDENATIEDLMERLYFLAKLEHAVKQANEGLVISHEEIEQEFLRQCELSGLMMPATIWPRFENMFRATLDTRQLQRFPLSGRVVPEVNEAEYRELIRGKYHVVYRIHDNEIEILMIFHSSRDPEDISNRLDDA